MESRVQRYAWNSWLLLLCKNYARSIFKSGRGGIIKAGLGNWWEEMGKGGAVIKRAREAG